MATPKYQILAEALREEILSGKLANNDKLCTEKELMEQYSVADKLSVTRSAYLKKKGMSDPVREAAHLFCPAGVPSSITPNKSP